MGDRGKKRTLRQSFMIANIDTPYNTIFGIPLLNELYTILFPLYLMMKFNANKRDSLYQGGPGRSQKRVHTSWESYDETA